MEKKIKGNSIFWALLKLNIIPIVILAVIITSYSTTRFATSMNQEVKNGLVDLCNTITTIYDSLYEGEYRAVEQDGAIYMLKGEHLLNGNTDIIDSIKEQTDVDVTIFCQDTRVLTTIMDQNGNRAIGTMVSAVVKREVLEAKQAKFYPNVMVEDEKYFAYYSPIIDTQGECVGMFFVGKPSDEVEQLVLKSVSPIILIAIFTMILAGCVTIRFSKQLVDAIRKTEHFLEKVSQGNLHAQIDYSVLHRKDELGEMGRYTVRMQKALRVLIEQDLLTGLNNRRSGEKMLSQLWRDCEREGCSFCIAIGDIDHFKHVNDTYGHACGDAVLSQISTAMRRHMKGKGFAARWGGEEFLLGFKDMELAESVASLEVFLDEIRNMVIAYSDDVSVSVTMTFGIVQGSTDSKIEHIIKDADDKLYYGKNNGRNQIVE